MSDVDELCDRVAFIVNGKLQEEDSPAISSLSTASALSRWSIRRMGK